MGDARDTAKKKKADEKKGAKPAAKAPAAKPAEAPKPTEAPAAAAKATDFKLLVSKVQLWVRKARMQSTVVEGHAQVLENAVAKYKLERVMTKTLLIYREGGSYSADGVFSGQIPKRVIICFVSNDAYNGKYELNPYNYVHLNVSMLAVYINGKCFPAIPFTPNYTHDAENDQPINYMREYRAMHDGAGVYHNNKSLGITYDEFSKGYCFYVIDLTQNQRANDTSSINLIKSGDLRIDVSFKTNVLVAHTMIVYGEFDNMFHINKNRQVTFQPIGGKRSRA
jgi:hypothetical protein